MLIAAGIVVAVPIVAFGVFITQFNPNAYAPQLAEAVYKATGRTLSFGGPLRLQLSLTPTLAASNVTLSNPSNFNAPDLLTLAQFQARIALLPLLHHRLDILELKLVQPKLYLERDHNGQPDWILHPAPQTTTDAQTGAHRSGGRSAYRVALESVSVEDAQIILRPTGTGQPTIIQLSRFTGKASSLNTPLHIAGTALIGATPFTLQGVVGPVSGLTGGNEHPWPVDLTFGFAGALATLQGQIANPQRLRGYDLHFSTRIPALEQVSAALPAAWLHGETLPALHDVAASLTVKDLPTGQLKLSDIMVAAGASDLSRFWPGLQLTSLKASLPAINATGTLAITGNVRQLPLAMQAQWAGMGGLLPPDSPLADMTAHGGFSGTMNASLGAATASLKGEIATPQSLSGAAWALALTVPDLSTLSAAWGTPLPAWKDINIKTMLTDSGGQGLAKGIGLDGLTASMQNARFGGNASLALGARPYLKLNLAIAEANLDALRAEMPATSQHASDSSPPASAVAQNASASQPPFGLLRRIDADVSLSADQLIYGGTPYSALQAHAVLKNGLLTIAPFTGQMPGGAISATGSLDTNVEPAAETLKFNAPALALGPLLKMLDLPMSGLAQGTIQLQVNASSRGDTLAAMRGAVSGQFGMASVNDEIDGALINQLFGQALRATGLPAAAINVAGPTFVRCFAMRLDAQDGSGRFKALALDSSRLLLVGGGGVNFASQTLDLVLKPQMRLGGSNVVIPVAIKGTFTKPRYGIASSAALAAAAQETKALMAQSGQPLLGGNSILGKVLGALTNHNSSDVCEAALPLARMGQSGPAPRAAAAYNSTPPAANPATNSGPRSLLKALLDQ